MFNLFKKEKNRQENENQLSLISVAALLIHSAKIDENFTEKERNIIKKALIEMGAKDENLEEIIREAEKKEQDSNQILDFTKEIKNLEINSELIFFNELFRLYAQIIGQRINYICRLYK